MLMSPDYEGNCHLLDFDGYCMLQRQCGEGVLPLICRVYPRLVRRGSSVGTVCTSSSCEKTIELLITDNAPLRIKHGRIPLPYDGIPSNLDSAEKTEAAQHCITIMSDRTHNIRDRISALGDFLGVPSEGGKSDISAAIAVIRHFITSVGHISASIADCGGRALDFLTGDGVDAFRSASDHLVSVLPDIEIYVEKILINHMFYEQFPYASSETPVQRAYSSFVTAAAMLRLITLCDMAHSDSVADFTDCAAEVFRFIEHTDYYTVGNRVRMPSPRTLLALF